MAVFNTGRIMGPSLAGWIIQYVGMGHALYFNAICYALGSVCLLMMSGVESRSQSETRTCCGTSGTASSTCG